MISSGTSKPPTSTNPWDIPINAAKMINAIPIINGIEKTNPSCDELKSNFTKNDESFA
ncbi:MAG: hypothetical protein OES34_13270 [Nitrosopumilus sp.]|nr:hypothetical protein [Nitrosopumilus sp.]